MRNAGKGAGIRGMERGDRGPANGWEAYAVYKFR